MAGGNFNYFCALQIDNKTIQQVFNTETCEICNRIYSMIVNNIHYLNKL